MKIVLDNIVFCLQRAGGISVYWTELLSRLKDKEHCYFFHSQNNNIFGSNLKFKNVDYEILPTKLLRYLPFTKQLPSKSIFHSSYYRVSLQKDVVNITTVHDFTYEYFKSGLPRRVHSWQKSMAIKKSDGIICVSENTKNDLLNLYPDINHKLIRVIYNGVSEDFYPDIKATDSLEKLFPDLVNKKYLLFIGDRSAYKNFDVVVEVLKGLKDFCLVIVGGGGLNPKELGFISLIETRVYHFQGIDSQSLNVLYNNAFCLAYPSSYEGFGIPVLEAMRAGCPVISTQFSSLPEVAGEAALLIDSINADKIIEKVVELEDEYFRNNIIDKGLAQAATFSWDKCFNETSCFYQEVFDKKFK